MNLDGLLAGSESAANLLVGHSRGYHCEHLALTGRQRCMAALKLLQLIARRLERAALLNRAADSASSASSSTGFSMKSTRVIRDSPQDRNIVRSRSALEVYALPEA